MIRSIADKFLRSVVNELFVDPGSFQVSSLTSDFFSDSTLNLENLTVRPDLFDVCLQPIRLVSGHVSKLSLDGIAQLALGGKLQLVMEDVYLLFEVHNAMGAERAQLLKKILIEMRSGKMQQVILREILKKIQGLPAGKDPNIKKKRKLSTRVLRYIFSSLFLSIKHVYIRLEVPTPAAVMNGTYSVGALGLNIPLVRILPGTNRSDTSATLKFSELNKTEPVLCMGMKGVMLYCDYDTMSYTSNGLDSAAITETFRTRRRDTHTSLVSPVDINIYVAAEITKGTDMLATNFAIHIPKVNFAMDAKQFSVIQQVLELMVTQQRRISHLTRVRGIFGNKWLPPRINEVGGIHIFPCLTIEKKQYPGDPSALPPAAHSAPGGAKSTLVTVLKARLGPNWAKGIWRHVLRLVIENNRLARPMGRWIELCKLIYMRKQYAFVYSKMLKRSTETGNLIFNVNAKVDSSIVLKLFELEMILPIDTIYLFRKLAVMVNFVELLNAKRRHDMAKRAAQQLQQQQLNIGEHGHTSPQQSAYIDSQATDEVSISWRDLLRVHTEIVERQSMSAFHRGERLNDVDDGATDAGYGGNGGDVDDAKSSYPSDEKPGGFTAWAARGLNQVAASTSSVASRPISSIQASTSKTVTSMQSSAMKVLSGITQQSPSVGSGPTSPAPVDGRSNSGTGTNHNHSNSSSSGSSSSAGSSTFKNLFGGNTDFSAFLELFGGLEKEDRVQDGSGGLSGLRIGSAISSLVGSSSTSTHASSNHSTTNSSGGGSSSGISHAPAGSTEKIALKDIHLTISEVVVPLSLRTTYHTPSEAAIVDAVHTTMFRYRSPLTITPPDVALKLGKLTASVRLPLNGGKRANVVTLAVDDVAANVSIATSPSTGNTAAVVNTSGKTTLSPSASSLQQQPQQILSATVLGGPNVGNGVVSLEGSLIQVRLTVGQAKVALTVNNRALAEQLDKSSIEQQQIKALTSLQYVSSSITPKSAVNSSAKSFGYVAEETPAANLSRDMITPQYDIVAETHRELVDGEETPMTAVTSNRSEGSADGDTDTGSTSGENYTYGNNHLSAAVSTSKQTDRELPDSTESNPNNANTTPVYKPRSIVSGADSNKSSQAAEAMAPTPSSALSLKSSLTGIAGMSPVVQIEQEDVIQDVVDVVSSEPKDRFLVLCLLLDYDRKGEGAADIQASIGDIKSDVNAKALSCFLDETSLSQMQEFLDINKRMDRIAAIGRSSHKFFLEYSISTESHSVEAAGSVGSSIAAMKRAAIISNLNFKYWFSYVEYFMPKDVTVVLRSSKIHADFLTASVIRDIVLSIAQETSDRASGVREGELLQTSLDALGKQTANDSVVLLRNMRRWATRHSAAIANGRNRTRVVISPMEVNFLKTHDPSAKVEFKAMGVECELPVNDETLSNALALVLAKYLPAY